jgi:hypothetical protein
MIPPEKRGTVARWGSVELEVMLDVATFCDGRS